MKFLLIALLSTSAFAHFKLGLYNGIDQDGQACNISFNKKTYRFGKKHPLNEEVHVHVVEPGNEFVLGHKALFTSWSREEMCEEFGIPQEYCPDTEVAPDGKIEPDKNALTGAKGEYLENFSSNSVLKVVMGHEEGKEGPQSYLLEMSINSLEGPDFLTGFIKCEDLKFVRAPIEE
jgi:hypothetical protein